VNDLNFSMEQILDKKLIITQEIIFLLCNQHVHFHVHKSVTLLTKDIEF